MARARSPEKREAILQAAAYEIAESGLAAPTSRIAARAGVAEGSLFTYFVNKEDLLNELYVELKSDVYRRMSNGFPQKASLEKRIRHIWSAYLEWALESPEKRRASVLLHVSVIVRPETRERAAEQRASVGPTFDELNNRESMDGLPKGFATATMSAMYETTIDFAAKQPRRRKEIVEQAFRIFWRSVK